MSTEKFKPGYFRVYVVSIDGAVEETFLTAIRDFVTVPLSQARLEIERRERKYDGVKYEIATDDSGIAEQYGIKLIEPKYK